MDPSWLRWARGLHAIAQNGLTFATDVYDRERYQAVRETAAEMMAANSDADTEFVRQLFAQETGYATPKVDVRGGRPVDVCEAASPPWGASWGADNAIVFGRPMRSPIPRST